MVESCKHLEPIFEYEINRGNKVKIVTNWGDYKVIDFKQSMDTQNIKSLFVSNDILYRFDKDPHYLFEVFMCEKCKVSIMGPLRNL